MLTISGNDYMESLTTDRGNDPGFHHHVDLNVEVNV